MNPTASPATGAEEAATGASNGHFIGGVWLEPSSSETIEVINSFTEEVMGSVPAGTAEDVDAAVEAARAALPAWRSLPVEGPGRTLHPGRPRPAGPCRGDRRP